MDGKTHVVKVIGGRAEFDKSGGGKPLLKIRITAEVDGVRSEYTITYGGYGENNEAVGRATAKADAPRPLRGRRREALSAGRGTDGEEAEGVPHEERPDNNRVRQRTPRRLRPLR